MIKQKHPEKNPQFLKEAYHGHVAVIPKMR